MSTQLAPLRPVESTRKLRSWLFIIVTNVISLICMAWVLNGAGLNQIWGEVQHMHYAWVLVAVLADVCVYLLHGWRWKLLLTPIESVRFTDTVEAIYVGLFANEVLPLRAGELIRCFLLSKTSEVPLSVTFASALIERIFDGVWLMACFFVCLHMGRLPGVLLKGGYILGVMIVVVAIVLAYAMYAKKQSLDLFFGMAWPRWFNTLIEDLHLIGHSRYLYLAFLVSGVYMMCQLLPIYFLVQANDLNVSWKASFTMLVLLRLSSVVPQAPGNLGPFQWVTARTLMMFGLGAGHAKRFSIILWAVVTIPLIVIGFIALALEGINMTHLHREATAAASNRQNRD
ncbi:MAG: flippase-like domain-containing protein [Acidobacteriaceae bacterium]|nr:flippase-like domain-containing protein [Acidobacteriaceae bacterium]